MAAGTQSQAPEARVYDVSGLLKLAIRFVGLGLTGQDISLGRHVRELPTRTIRGFRSEMALQVINGHVAIDAFEMLFGSDDTRILCIVKNLCEHFQYELSNYTLDNLLTLWEYSFRRRNGLTPELCQDAKRLRQFIQERGRGHQIERINRGLASARDESWQRPIVEHFLNLPEPDRKNEGAALKSQLAYTVRGFADARPVLDEISACKKNQSDVSGKMASLDTELKKLRKRRMELEKKLVECKASSDPVVRRRIRGATRSLTICRRRATDIEERQAKLNATIGKPARRVRGLRSELITRFGPVVNEFVRTHSRIREMRGRKS